MGSPRTQKATKLFPGTPAYAPPTAAVPRRRGSLLKWLIENPALGSALIAATALITAALINGVVNIYNGQHAASTIALPPSSKSSGGDVILKGSVVNKSGRGIPDIIVSVGVESSDITSVSGAFILRRVPTGDQDLELKSQSGGHAARHKIFIEPQGAATIQVVYDVERSRLGLLSVMMPVNEGDWKVSKWLETNEQGMPVAQYGARVSGRCDGLREQYDKLGIWVVLKSSRDGRYWVQRQAAFDETSNHWWTDVLLGDALHPPSSDERWDILAVAAEHDSGIQQFQSDRISIPHPNSLPPHVESNQVSVTLSGISHPQKKSGTP